MTTLAKQNAPLAIDPELEKEAEETAQRVMEGGKLDIQRMEDTEVHVQRTANVPPGSRGTPGETISDTTGFGDDLDVAKEGGKAAGKEFLKRFVPNEIIAAYEAVQAEKHKQQTDELAQLKGKLEKITPPKSWMDSISDYTMDEIGIGDTVGGDSTGDVDMEAEYGQ